MLDDFRNPVRDHAGHDHLDTNHAGSNQRKIAMILTALALILAGSLFFSGPSDSSHQDPKNLSDVADQLAALHERVEALESKNKEIPSQTSSFIALSALEEVSPPSSDNSNQPKSPATLPVDSKEQAAESLKALIAKELASDTSIQQTEPPATEEPSYTKPKNPSQSTNAPKSTVQPKKYVVQRGDTLSVISQKVYGTSKRWKEIADANKDKVTADNQVRAGTSLTIP